AWAGDIVTDQPSCAALAAPLDHAVEHGQLELPLKHPAAHDPEIDPGRDSIERGDHDGGEAVAAESITETTAQNQVVGAGHQRFELAQEIAPPCEIKLVGLLNELPGPRLVEL